MIGQSPFLYPNRDLAHYWGVTPSGADHFVVLADPSPDNYLYTWGVEGTPNEVIDIVGMETFALPYPGHTPPTFAHWIDIHLDCCYDDPWWTPNDGKVTVTLHIAGADLDWKFPGIYWCTFEGHWTQDDIDNLWLKIRYRGPDPGPGPDEYRAYGSWMRVWYTYAPYASVSRVSNLFGQHFEVYNNELESPTAVNLRQQNGKDWTSWTPLTLPGLAGNTIEAAIACRNDGKLPLMVRTDGTPPDHSFLSPDDGETWIAQ